MQKIIMAVDDETSVLHSLKRVFRNKKYNFIPFNSPVKAVFALRKIKPHIIICDQRMPYIHGIDFLSKAKSISQRNLRIMLTGFDIQKAKPRYHIDRIIMKPWDNDELEYEIMNTIIHRNKIFVPVSPTSKADSTPECFLCGFSHTSHEIRLENYSSHICLDCHGKFIDVDK